MLLIITVALALSGLPVSTSLIEDASSDDAGMVRYEWRANTFTPSAQEEAALAVAQDNSLVVVWSSRRQQDGRYGILAQRFDQRGVAWGEETAVSPWNGRHATAPTVTTDATGGVWFVWQAHGMDGERGGIFGRRSANGGSLGEVIAINQQTRGHQCSPQIAASTEGLILVVWNSVSDGTPQVELRGRVFDAAGGPLSDEFHIAGGDGGSARTPAICAGADGRFAIAYAHFDAAGEPQGIRLRLLDPFTALTGDDENLCGEVRESQIEPVIAATTDGFVVVWLDAESDGDDYGLRMRRLDRDGRPISAAEQVHSAAAGLQNGAAIAVAADGRFAVSWNNSDGDKVGVYSQRFDREGLPIGSEFRLSKATRGTQALRQATATPCLAWLADGSLACAWSGNCESGDESAANVTLVARRPLELAGAVQGVTAEMSAVVGGHPSLGAAPHEPPVFDPNYEREDVDREFVLRTDTIGFTGITNTGWTPPDPNLAVGPEHLVAITNGEIAFFKKDGTKDFSDEIEDRNGFWGSLGTTGFVFDPEALYDDLSGRFFVMAAEAFAPGNKSYVLVAVSDDSDPNGTWYKYRFETTELSGNLFDSPNIGVDGQAVYITGDGFGKRSNYPVYIFDKDSLLNGESPQITKSFEMTTSTQSAGIPPVSHDDPPALYMIEHKEKTTNTSVRLIALTDPLGSPTTVDFTLTVPSYGPPESPPQKGTSTRPNTYDARFWSVAYRNGSLWATHHINSSNVLARWYEVAMNGWPESGNDPTLVQSGEIAPGSKVRTSFSAITVDANGTAALVFARSAPTEYLSMATAYRFKSDEPGTFRTDVIQKASTAPSNSGRWGDYAAIRVDPANGRQFWAIHEYTQGSDDWRTWVAGFTPDYPLGDVNCDGSVDFDDIDPFVQLLIDPESYGDSYPSCDPALGDINGSGAADFDDIDGFVALLI